MIACAQFQKNNVRPTALFFADERAQRQAKMPVEIDRSVDMWSCTSTPQPLHLNCGATSTPKSPHPVSLTATPSTRVPTDTHKQGNAKPTTLINRRSRLRKMMPARWQRLKRAQAESPSKP
ncbi:hypothetical protein I4F81_010669 [Pyropia yezoensis]|uniref:Uncharacterized protein n=1 Tax=Pyropia yezoensis TaxID=2788 RepID=A0ACC3CDY4_PYRYE|nr:hypothetical protein I4F81_010669 [Neopyropia yezoensis]